MMKRSIARATDRGSMNNEDERTALFTAALLWMLSRNATEQREWLALLLRLWRRHASAADLLIAIRNRLALSVQSDRRRKTVVVAKIAAAAAQLKGSTSQYQAAIDTLVGRLSATGGRSTGKSTVARIRGALTAYAIAVREAPQPALARDLPLGDGFESLWADDLPLAVSEDRDEIGKSRPPRQYPRAQSYERGESVTVWFGTNRIPVPDAKRLGDRFGAKRNEHSDDQSQLSYGRAEVHIPATHQEGTLRRPKWWRLERRENPDAHIILTSLTVQDLATWKEGARHQDSEGLLFIHGFSVPFQDALFRTAQLAFDLKFAGVPFCFSWPSGGRIHKYPDDTASIAWSEDHLREFLDLVTSSLGLTRLHIIAHSMGNRALVEVLCGWNKRRNAARVGQVVLAAPDVDTGKFRQRVRKFGKFEQVTLYASRNDRALLASKALYSGPRAGYARPVVVMDGVSTIDVSGAGGNLFGLGHGYIANAGKVFDDLFYLVGQGLRPENRRSVRKVKDRAYYELV
jgi:esterase/lipase superfamily enzyme